MKKPEEKQKIPHTSVCGSSRNETHPTIGCGESFQEHQYNRKAHLCLDCSNQMAGDYGVSFENIDFVNTAKFNERYYTSITSGFEKYDERTRVRILILAVNGPILKASDEEKRAALKLRGFYPESLGKVWNIYEKPVKDLVSKLAASEEW